ncbi:hypothetical protein [Chryseobacterium soli]|uniref:hypothetical protein n=1 Tax=Chryseobacterium soli TaxID=445961 RepID=UPI0021CD9061|nr:hypothetical protein [Chryseobacterium soli]
MQYHLEGNGRCQRKYHTYFHTSHPQLCGYMRNSKKWKQVSAKLNGDNKVRSIKSLQKTGKGIQDGKKLTGGFGGHFRAVQGFKYLGNEEI